MSSNDGGGNNGGGGAPPYVKRETATGGKKYHQRNNFQKPIVRQPKFEGKCDALKGHIYDCSDARQSDQFTKTTKEIADYVGREFKNQPGDTRTAIMHLENLQFIVPEDPAIGANQTELLIWRETVVAFVK